MWNGFINTVPLNLNLNSGLLLYIEYIYVSDLYGMGMTCHEEIENYMSSSIIVLWNLGMYDYVTK